MNKRIVFRNMDKSDAIERYANERLEKIVDFLATEPTPISIDLVLEPSAAREHHRVELRVKTPRYDLIADREHQGDDFYKTLDHVIDVMFRNLIEAKRKALDERDHGTGSVKKF